MTIEEIQNEIDAANDEAFLEAQEEFTRKTGAELREQCHRLVEATAERYALIMKGESPRAFGAYDRDEIARILNADLAISYDGYDLNMSPDPSSITDWQDCAIETTLECEAEEGWDRAKFIEAYEKYLYTAAAFAKSIGASHAMRLYLRAWGLVGKACPHCGYRVRLFANEALHVVNLERVATERLWVEVEAAKLPAFKPKRPARPRKAAAKKRKGGR